MVTIHLSEFVFTDTFFCLIIWKWSLYSHTVSVYLVPYLLHFSGYTVYTILVFTALKRIIRHTLVSPQVLA